GIRGAHSRAALCHGAWGRDRASCLHLRHSIAVELGRAAALRSRIDSRCAYSGRVHRCRRAASKRRYLRTTRPNAPGTMNRPPLPGKRKTKWPVAVLGATGAVGQMFVRLLSDHPWFEITELAASERSAGKKYGEVTRWLDGPLPPAMILNRRVIACDPGVVSAPIVFSALDATVALEVETAFATAGKFVLSNAKSFRME